MTSVMTLRKHIENMIAEHKSHMDYAVTNNLPDMHEVCQQTIDYLSQHPVMQDGKEEKIYNAPHGLASRLPVDDEQPESIKPNSLAGLNEAIKNHPNGGSYVVISDNPLHQPLRFAWCQSITPRSNPSQDLDTHSSNLL